ncbi:autophagy-related protein 27-domain-containing protein [Mycena amicta]|nr:autophagy-related protein 27-domain-containing protein [Mycena amicta]
MCPSRTRNSGLPHQNKSQGRLRQSHWRRPNSTNCEPGAHLYYPYRESLSSFTAVHTHIQSTRPTCHSRLISSSCAQQLRQIPASLTMTESSSRLSGSTPAGCGFLGSEEPPSDDKKSPEDSRPHSGGLSSIGWFLLLLVLGFATYMGLGAYYQYSTYGAQGLDLIPHRDFWTELPVLLRDVLCTAVRPRRSSRGGYIAV